MQRCLCGKVHVVEVDILEHGLTATAVETNDTGHFS